MKQKGIAKPIEQLSREEFRTLAKEGKTLVNKDKKEGR